MHLTLNTEAERQ